MTCASGRLCLKRSARLEPTNPAPPVIRIFSIDDVRDDPILDVRPAAQVVELAVVLDHQVVMDEAALRPDLHQRREIASSQGPDVELGRTPSPSVPTDRYRRDLEPAYEDAERHLDGQIEVRRIQGHQRPDRIGTV